MFMILSFKSFALPFQAASIMIAAFLGPSSLAIPQFDGGYLSENQSDIMEELLNDAVPNDIPLLGFKQSDLLDFYEDRQFQPVFWKTYGWDLSLKQAFDLLVNADEEALDPNDYRSKEMKKAPIMGDDNVSIIAFDLQLTVLFARYAHDLAIGRYNPTKSENGFDLLAKGLTRIANDDSLTFAQWLDTIAPNTLAYQRLIAFYRKISTKPLPERQSSLPKEGPLLSMSIEHPDVPLLREELIKAAFMPQTEASDSALFDETLDTGVRTFQRISGLKVDGQVGNITRTALANYDIDINALIQVNLERLRWEETLTTNRYIRVNIADFRMQVFEDSNVMLDMKVIVGRPERRTPLLSDKITNLKFSPDWTVPRSIFQKDYLSQIKTDQDFIKGHGFQVKQGGKIIDANDVDWDDPNDYNQVALYRPSSNSGPLGAVRFSLSNNLSIYLHDTSRPDLFNSINRSRSSGCVRVQEPAALAKFLLAGTKWDAEAIDNAMNSEFIQYAQLNDEVQVYLSYMTLWINDNNELQLASDPYDLDSELLLLFAE